MWNCASPAPTAKCGFCMSATTRLLMTGQDGQFPVQDITERKRAEDSLCVREALFEVLTENSYDLIRLHELDGRSIYANPAVVQLLGEESANLFHDIHPQ